MTASRHRGQTTATTRLAGARALLALLLACCSGASADDLAIAVEGVRDPLLANVRSRIDVLQAAGKVRLTPRRLERITEQAERESLLALRPYGYYRASVTTKLNEVAEGSWRREPGSAATLGNG